MLEHKKKYAALPFWSWNDKLDKDELLKQIRWMHENGIGGFFMHARSGLVTEYLSEEWMQCIDACAKEAKRLGMTAWIYDENGFPSGFVGGKLLEEESNRDQYIVANIGDFDEQATVSYLLLEDELVRVAFKEQDGEYLNLQIERAVSTADILNPKVVDQFIALTHEKYQAYFGEQFADMIEGFFTDEPQYYRYETPYTDVVATYYKETYNRDILDDLGLLFVEKKGYRRFRYRYWKAMQTLMLKNYAERVYEWCEEHGVKFTGHYIEENSLCGQMMCCAGVMPFYEYEHIPGIDWLGRRVAPELSPRQVGSVAAQLGKKQVLTETYAYCGWDILPSDLRRITGFQFANGANMICHHLLPYSERGSRKYDYPAHYSDVNPWVAEEFGTFNDYYTELGSILGEGTQHVNVAMLHPIRSAYFDYKESLKDERCGIRDLEQSLKEACRLLSSHGVEYHFLDETLLAKYGFVNGSSIGCGQCSYDYLVLPSVLTMDITTEKLLQEYIRQGGKVLVLGEKPSYLEGEEYTYDYLHTNVTLEEIMEAQAYQVQIYNTDIYSTYRTLGDKTYLYVTNSSEEEQTQTFTFGGKLPSLTVTLKSGEDALLEPGKEIMTEEKTLDRYVLQFHDASVHVKENYLPIDKIAYSTDGKEFSKPWPCPALFQKLLSERYTGPLFLKYEFDVEELPKRIFLRTEKSNDVAAWLNGQVLSETVPSKESYVNTYDITPYVKSGINSYVTQIDWFQNEQVFFALFGENVTESLRNCLTYDTELQPIELVGDFGVYPREGYVPDEDSRYVRGDRFYIGQMPERISEPSTEGFPFHAGEMILKQTITLDDTNVLLHVAGDYPTAMVTVNGQYAGKLFFEKDLDISGVAQKGENDIEVRFLLSNRNLMGPHHRRGNKNGPVTPIVYQRFGTWEDDESAYCHADYDIKKFY